LRIRFDDSEAELNALRNAVFKAFSRLLHKAFSWIMSPGRSKQKAPQNKPF
jgi:hypothetical protein